MADITKAANASPVDVLYLKPQVRQAAVEISRGDAIYLDTNNKWSLAARTIQLASGTFGTMPKFAGFAAEDIPSGTFGSVYGRGSEWNYAASGLTEGGAVFLSATAGDVADAAPVANDHPIGICSSTTNILLTAGV